MNKRGGIIWIAEKQKQTHLFKSRYDLQQYLSYCGNIGTDA